MTQFQQAITAGRISAQEALELFDSLAPADIEFLLGNWKGSEFPTGHRLDGMLASYHWYGKRFRSAEDVDPLVFRKADGALTTVNPVLIMPGVPFAGRVPFLKTAWVGRIFQGLVPFLTTSKPRATLRMVDFRGHTSAAMVYNDLPITDSFRKVDEDTVLGCMDMKGMEQPYFFVLRREK
jgi:hypothetical protein